MGGLWMMPPLRDWRVQKLTAPRGGKHMAKRNGFVLLVLTHTHCNINAIVLVVIYHSLIVIPEQELKFHRVVHQVAVETNWRIQLDVLESWAINFRLGLCTRNIVSGGEDIFVNSCWISSVMGWREKNWVRNYPGGITRKSLAFVKGALERKRFVTLNFKWQTHAFAIEGALWFFFATI